MWRWWPGRRQPSDRDIDPIAREKERALKLFGEQPAEDMHPYAPPPGPVQRVRAVDDSPPQNTIQMMLIAFGILSGAMLGLLLLADDPGGIWKDARKGFVAVSGGMGYLNCAHVRLVGAAPLHKGDKGYSKALDSDGNGIACEPLIKSGDPATDGGDTPKKKRG